MSVNDSSQGAGAPGLGEPLEREWTAGFEHAGRRLDQVLSEVWADFSRSRIAAWIRSGEVTVDGHPVKPRHALGPDEAVRLTTRLDAHPDNPRPQAIELEVLIDDPDVLVVNKPPGLVVHPGSGNPDGTLVNALLHFDPALSPLPRAGLVHRLDKDTSGCLVVARTLQAHRFLVEAMKQRAIKRHYQALVWGRVIAGDSVDQPIGRHPVDRRRQVIRPDGRAAVTHYRIARRLDAVTLLDVELETGRTHQIRVHMQSIGHPIVGDPVYGRRGLPGGLSDDERALVSNFKRQALHARRIRLPHPDGTRTLEADAAMPDDFRALVDGLGA
jgi:23S rRNA pseudouridine1911/1915/1917 synthase